MEDDLLFLKDNADYLNEFVIINGRLARKRHGWWKLLTTTNYQEVRTRIEEILHHVNDHRNQYPLSDAEIRTIIIDRLLPAVDDGLFKPQCLYKKTTLQNIILPALAEARTANQDIMAKHVAKAQLMSILKMGLVRNKGCSKSLIIRWFDLPGKELGVFKYNEAHSGIIQNLTFQVQYSMNMQISHLKMAGLGHYQAEIAAYILDQYFEFNMVCQTVTATINGQTGSFQLFIPHTHEARVIIPLLESTIQYTDSDVENFQQLTVLDYILGDLDGHDENWLVQRDHDNLMAKIYKIDNSNTFIERNPSSQLISDCKQYVWSRLRIAQISYRPKIRHIMKKMTSVRIDELCRIIDDKLPIFLNIHIRSSLHQRARILYLAADIEDFNPQWLGSLRTDEEIHNFCGLHDPNLALSELDFHLIDS